MGAVTYFTMADNDYEFLKQDYDNHRVGNVMCYVSQNICERYLKHIIDVFYQGETDTTTVLQTHSIKILKKFLTKEMPEFCCNWSIVMNVNGYYFSTRYPGTDSFIADKDDVEEAWAAVLETRRAVTLYMEQHKKKAVSILEEIESLGKKRNNIL